MKWKEPWGVSLRQQARFNPLGKPMLTTFLSFCVVFVAVFVLGNWGKDAQGWLESLKIAPVVVLGFSAVLALFVRYVTWLSPRAIEFGRHGIVVQKADDCMLIPWAAVADHRFVSVEGDPALQITSGAGEVARLFLSSTVSRPAIERALAQHLRVSAAAL